MTSSKGLGADLYLVATVYLTAPSKSWISKYSHKHRVVAEKNRRWFSQALCLFDVRPGGSRRVNLSSSNGSSIRKTMNHRACEQQR